MSKEKFKKYFLSQMGYAWIWICAHCNWHNNTAPTITITSPRWSISRGKRAQRKKKIKIIKSFISIVHNIILLCACIFSSQYNNIGCCGDRVKFLIYRFWWSFVLLLLLLLRLTLTIPLLLCLRLFFFSLSLFFSSSLPSNWTHQQKWKFLIYNYCIPFYVQCVFICSHAPREFSIGEKVIIKSARLSA